MRVLHVSEVAWGGVVSLVQEFSAEQLRRGHDVALLAPSAFPPIEAVQHLPWEVVRRRPATYPRALAQLRAAIRRQQPDVVHLHSAVAGILGRLPLAGVAGDVPVVYQPHAWSFDLFDRRSLSRLLATWERAASRRTTVLVGNCSDEIDEGLRLGMDLPAFALGVPLDGEYFHPVDAEAAAGWRRRLGTGFGHMVVCLGRLAKQKGQDLLIPAWEAEPLPDTELVLVGPGDGSDLAALAPTQWGKTIRWAGEQADVRPWLWASDLLVLPSRYETVAVVVGEAMACGRPVVATAVNGARMAVQDEPLEPAGAVVAVGDMAALLDEARRRLEDSQLWQQEAQAARRRALVLFDRSTVADRLELAYAEAIKAGTTQEGEA